MYIYFVTKLSPLLIGMALIAVIGCGMSAKIVYLIVYVCVRDRWSPQVHLAQRKLPVSAVGACVDPSVIRLSRREVERPWSIQ